MAPLPVLDHHPRDGARDVEQTLDVRVNHLVPVHRVALVDVLEPGSQSGIVDQYVDRAEMAGQRVDRALGLETVAHVESEDQRLDAEFLFQAVVEGLQPVRPTTGDDQIVTQFGQRPCGGGSYARGSSRDKCRFAHVPVRFVLRPGGHRRPEPPMRGNPRRFECKNRKFCVTLHFACRIL